ncbi:IS110 family transposase [Desulfolithobacter dissulfuricans]|nr:IS110 family transposase [Desulfolithobacter dissulfuricans]
MHNVTIGMDLGDKNHVICIVDHAGRIVRRDTVTNTREALSEFFSPHKGATVALEAGTHSAWISRLLSRLGCHVLVGNPRKLRAIWDSNDKSDTRDAEMLARIARMDPDLLYPVNHRGEQAQIDLEILQARDVLVRNRSSLINHVRGSVKALGYRLPGCSADSFHRQADEHLPEDLRGALEPVLTIIGQITSQIKEFDREIERISAERYPETELLRAIKGVGPLTALAFLLIVEDPARFGKSRQVGCFLGLTPRRDQSGETDRQLRITKAGNPYLRRLLVGSAQYILGPFGEDCNLRRFGLRLAARGGKNAKRRAVVAVARKLAVLMHRLWQHGEIYDPFYKPQSRPLAKAA